MPRKIISKQSVSMAPPQPMAKKIIIEKLNFIIEPFKARHRRHYHDSHFHFWADLLLAGVLVGLVAIVVLLVFWQPKAAFNLSGHFSKARLMSGQIEELVIRYGNEEDETITGVNLKLDLPDNFIIQSVEPAELFNASANTFTLGDLKKNDKGEIKLQGLIFGQIGEREFIGLNLTYQFKGLNKQLLDSIVYKIDGSVLELKLEVPEETYQAVAFFGNAEIKNTGQADLNNLALSFPEAGWEIVPNDFTLTDGRLILPTILAGQTMKVDFLATAKQSPGTSALTVKAWCLINDKILEQTEQSRMIKIAEPSLGLVANFINKSLVGNQATVTLNLKNTAEEEISNLSLAFISKRETMSVVSLSTTAEDFITVNNSLTYNKNLASQEEVNPTIVIQLEAKGFNLNDFLSLNIKVAYKMGGKDFNYFMALPNLKMNSNLSVNSAAYYYGPQGDQLGIGPLPPQVDIPTTYWVIWEANNLGNDLSNFEVSADLPVNVVWLDQKSVVEGDVSYSPVSRRVLWQVDKIGQTGGNFRVSFAISLVSRNQDIGTEPVLLSNIKFQAQDLYTDDLISKNLANITTNITEDRQAAGKSIVEPLK